VYLDLEFLSVSVVLLIVAAFCVGLSKGGLPGVGMIAVPLLSLTMSPIKAAALLLPLYILSDGVAVYLYRQAFDKENLKILLPAGLLGVFFGWLTASMISESAVSLLIGVLGVGYCFNSWLRKDTHEPGIKPSRYLGYFWGTLSGFTSFISHAGAPPYQIYMLPQKLPKLVFAGTTTFVFAAVNLAKIVPYALIEPFTVDMLSTAMMYLPAALIGTMVGKMGVHKLSERWFYLLVQTTLFLICAQLIYRSIMAYTVSTPSDLSGAQRPSSSHSRRHGACL